MLEIRVLLRYMAIIFFFTVRLSIGCDLIYTINRLFIDGDIISPTPEQLSLPLDYLRVIESFI